MLKQQIKPAVFEKELRGHNLNSNLAAVFGASVLSSGFYITTEHSFKRERLGHPE